MKRILTRTNSATSIRTCCVLEQCVFVMSMSSKKSESPSSPNTNPNPILDGSASGYKQFLAARNVRKDQTPTPASAVDLKRLTSPQSTSSISKSLAPAYDDTPGSVLEEDVASSTVKKSRKGSSRKTAALLLLAAEAAEMCSTPDAVLPTDTVSKNKAAGERDNRVGDIIRIVNEGAESDVCPDSRKEMRDLRRQIAKLQLENKRQQSQLQQGERERKRSSSVFNSASNTSAGAGPQVSFNSTPPTAEDALAASVASAAAQHFDARICAWLVKSGTVPADKIPARRQSMNMSSLGMGSNLSTMMSTASASGLGSNSSTKPRTISRRDKDKERDLREPCTGRTPMTLGQEIVEAADGDDGGNVKDEAVAMRAIQDLQMLSSSEMMGTERSAAIHSPLTPPIETLVPASATDTNTPCKSADGRSAPNTTSTGCVMNRMGESEPLFLVNVFGALSSVPSEVKATTFDGNPDIHLTEDEAVNSGNDSESDTGSVDSAFGQSGARLDRLVKRDGRGSLVELKSPLRSALDAGKYAGTGASPRVQYATPALVEGTNDDDYDSNNVSFSDDDSDGSCNSDGSTEPEGFSDGMMIQLVPGTSDSRMVMSSDLYVDVLHEMLELRATLMMQGY